MLALELAGATSSRLGPARKFEELREGQLFCNNTLKGFKGGYLGGF